MKAGYEFPQRRRYELTVKLSRRTQSTRGPGKIFEFREPIATGLCTEHRCTFDLDFEETMVINCVNVHAKARFFCSDSAQNTRSCYIRNQEGPRIILRWRSWSNCQCVNSQIWYRRMPFHPTRYICTSANRPSGSVIFPDESTIAS